MFEKMNEITLSGEVYPLRCDMVVLEQIQDAYGTVEVFEERLLPYKKRRGEDGDVVLDADGDPVYDSKIPDIGVVNRALELFVREGLEIQGKKLEDSNTLLRKVDIACTPLALLLHGEFMRCFEQKNAQTPEKKTEE